MYCSMQCLIALLRLQWLKGESAYSTNLSNCQRGTEVQSISGTKLCSVREEAIAIRGTEIQVKHCSNLPSLNQDNLVTYKNCLSTYTKYSIACSVEIVTSM